MQERSCEKNINQNIKGESGYRASEPNMSYQIAGGGSPKVKH